MISLAAVGALALAMSLVLGASVTSAAPQTAAGRQSEPAVFHKASAGSSPFRTIITTDTDGVLKDDFVSLHRFLLYSNEFADSVKGIVYSSFFVDRPAGTWPTELIQNLIRDKYSLVYKNLKRHDSRYPSPERLVRLVKVGNILGIGDMSYDSEGSLLIKQELLSNDRRPLYLQTWGGTNTIAAALRSIEEQYSASPKWPKLKSRISANAKIYIILDQDAVFKQYLDKTWPELDVIMNHSQYGPFAYPNTRATTVPADVNEQYFGVGFMERLTQGPLLETMPVANGSRGGVGTCWCEGDSPAMFYIFPSGLRSEVDPSYGGWGGRFEKTAAHRWSDSPAYMSQPDWWRTSTRPPTDGNVKDKSPYGAQFDNWYPQSRWIPVIQNDFLARAEWQTASYKDANHAPRVSIRGGRLDVSAKRGQRVELLGQATDPDRDWLSAKWWQYQEADTYPGAVTISKANSLKGASFKVPADARRGQTIHVILEVTDNGEIPLTRYQRVVITVK